MSEPGSDLSIEQVKALAPGISLIEAGPGSGKTRTVVARFRQQAAGNRGVALFSFTNAAVNVARARCASTPQILDSPDFVGTFDRFFHRYVVTPAEMRAGRGQPQYFASWDDLPDHLSAVRPSGGGVGVRLCKWLHLGDDIFRLDESKLNHHEQQMWDNLSPYSQGQIRDLGASRIRSLLGRQIYDTASARLLAVGYLQAESRLTKLALRFKEVIVDEFQDCDVVEHQLLNALAGAGVHVVAVADPDQAIYEFRQVGAAAYQRYRATVPASKTAVLSTCYRSTPAICALATALRSESASSITSHLPATTPCPPIQVVVGTGTRAGAAASKLVSRHQIPYESTRIIAHKRMDARALASPGNRAGAGNSTMGQVIEAVADLIGSVDIRLRRSAMTRLEKAFLGLVNWPDDGQPDTRQSQLESLGMTEDQLRIIARRIVDSSQGWTDARAATDQVRSVVSDASRRLGVSLVPTLGRKLAKPQGSVWAYWLARSADAPTVVASRIKWTHVHAVKGDEFDAVIYALPSRALGGSHVVDDWQNGVGTEARRVLYVGVTRARSLAILVTPPGRLAQLEQVLRRDGVPYELTRA